MATSIDRIVVQATPAQKKAIAAKAKKLGLPISELMRRGAALYQEPDGEEELGALADAAREGAERASAAIDAAMEFIAESNQRIAAAEAEAKRRAEAKR